MENQKRVLIADADDAFREALIDALAEEGDLEVVGYTDDGERAVELCQTLRPDVLVMDLLLNRMDGMDVISVLGREKLPILVVSASCRGVAGNLALNRGASYCMLKPCKLPAVAERIRELTAPMDAPCIQMRSEPSMYPAYCAQATASRCSLVPKVIFPPSLRPCERSSAAMTVKPCRTYHCAMPAKSFSGLEW